MPIYSCRNLFLLTLWDKLKVCVFLHLYVALMCWFWKEILVAPFLPCLLIKFLMEMVFGNMISFSFSCGDGLVLKASMSLYAKLLVVVSWRTKNTSYLRISTDDLCSMCSASMENNMSSSQRLRYGFIYISVVMRCLAAIVLVSTMDEFYFLKLHKAQLL